MTHQQTYVVHPRLSLLLIDLGINPAHVLRRAGLPEDLFGREKATVSTTEYFRLWNGIEEESGDPALPLRFAEIMSVESFDPLLFAALCSPDLNTALERMSRYKQLIYPMTLHIRQGVEATSIEVEWFDAPCEPPVSLVASELVFFVQFSRIATRTHVQPLEVRVKHPLEPADEYAEYFGVPVQEGPCPQILFKAEDAARPFLTANEEMWQFFEPDLQRRLFELNENATLADRVRAALLEQLPSGIASIGNVAKRLHVSTRTLQRKLKLEGLSFQTLLNQTREDLARHYLKNSQLTGVEISFLLGFKEPNSFFRAFHTWTGTTPEKVRKAAQ